MKNLTYKMVFDLENLPIIEVLFDLNFKKF